MFVKICGITNETDALLAVALGADAIGFIFAPSPRQMTAKAVADITKRLPEDILTIGVFRNTPSEQVIDTVYTAGLKGAQLHGVETKQECRTIAASLSFVIKAFSFEMPQLSEANDYPVHAIMIDGISPGSGEIYDYDRAGSFPVSSRLILAGGLNADNVADAVRKVQPWGVDVASGVEEKPGIKDPRKLRLFIKNAKASLEGDGK